MLQPALQELAEGSAPEETDNIEPELRKVSSSETQIKKTTGTKVLRLGKKK